ncbi:MAG: ABC transporter ATP-binding protein [Gammaproteobacteria bacterium]|nr:ABC transporter ATP-binding protein [Gammaproteobacteria bacterium]MDA8015384.1 ABC transporter ATP-binding protein [Gammaproteobacteria bacterium]
MSADVQLDDVWIRFGAFVAARNANIHIKEGEFFSFLGPSGCGKTTLLRAVSGFLEPSQGRVLIGGRDMAGIGPNKRPTALIFQNLALFPLMTVWENISFALEVRGVGRDERRRKADELLELIALPGQGEKRVGELSGGQKQRVAIARALAAEPDVLLLDEPLSALDLKLRQHMRTELRAIQQRVGITFIYITHDQGEALTMSDHVAVMSQGVIEQVADGNTIYDHPQSAFVASFVGENNLFAGKVTEAGDEFAVVETPCGALRARHAKRDGKGQLSPGDRAFVFVRPESLKFADNSSGEKFDNTISARIHQQEFEGNFWQVFFNVAGSDKQIKLSMVNDGRALGHAPGEEVQLGFNASLSVALPEGDLAAE